MSKPTKLPQWADTVSADTTRYSEPTTGKKQVGWAPEERPANQTINWLFNIIYQWCVYLDGLFTDIAGNAWAWTGNQTHAGTSAFAGGITGNPNFTGNPTVAGTLGVTGVATFTAVPTAPDYKQTSVRRRGVAPISGGPWQTSAGDWRIYNSCGVRSTASGTPEWFRIPLHVEEGESITVFITVEDSTATAGAIVCSLERVNCSNGTTVIVDAQSSLAASGLQTRTLASSPHTAVFDNEYYIIVTPDVANTVCDRTIYSVRINYTRP